MKIFNTKANLLIYLLAVCCFLHSQTSRKSVQTPALQNIKNKIIVGTFITLPNEIDGGSCVFYSSLKDKKNGIYICANDMANFAFMFINGKMEKFSLIDSKQKGIFTYRNKQYSLVIKIFSRRDNKYESSIIEGKIIITSNGIKTELPFIGDCSM
jgi:hypothetical protein